MTLPYPFPDSLMMFFIYSFVGWIVEVVYYGITEGEFINRGYLSGPLCPVYGLGFYLGIWVFEPLTGNFFVTFFGTAFAATFVELIAGVLLYHLFHMRWWDYTEYKFNLHGYICLRFFLYWGIACSLGLYVLHPAVKRLIAFLPLKAEMFILAVLSVILLVDIIISTAVVIGLSQKIRRLEKLNEDMHFFSNKIGSSIYDTVDAVVTLSGPTREHYEAYRKVVNEHRAEEKNLAAIHRAEERRLAAEFTSLEKDNLKQAMHNANAKKNAFFASLKHPERRIIATIKSHSGDLHFNAISMFKERAPLRRKSTVAVEVDPLAIEEEET